MIARCKKLKTTQAAEKLQKQGIHAADLFPASVSITLLLAHNRSNRKKSSKHSSSSKKKDCANQRKSHHSSLFLFNKSVSLGFNDDFFWSTYI